jgi:flagellar biogenesis protein FliO
MNMLSLLRTLGGLGVVLGLLAGALWVVRRYDVRLLGRIGGGSARRLELVERLTVDAKRSVALIRRDGCEHLIFIDPAGAVVVESGIPCGRPEQAEPEVRAGDSTLNDTFSADQTTSFGDVLQRVQTRFGRPRGRGEVGMIGARGAQPHD